MTTSPVVTVKDDLLAELDHLASCATGGDWEFRLCEIRTNHDSDGYTVIAEAPTCNKNWRNQRDTNMRYIATASPAVMQLLVAELSALRAENAELKAELECEYSRPYV